MFDKLKKVILTILIFILSGCSFSDGSKSKPGETYLSLSPATTEIIYALGAQKNLVGVTDFCNYPAEAKEKESVGNFMNPSLEKIFSLNPDIVFDAGLPQKKLIDKLKKRGIKVITVEPENIEQLKESIKRIGKITKRKDKSRKVISKIHWQLKEVTQKAANVNRKKVYVEISANPMMTAGRKSFITELIDIAGGINVAGDVAKNYFTAGFEFLVEKQPDVILLLSQNPDKRKKELERILDNKGRHSKKPEIFPVSVEEKDLFLRPGPRIGRGARRMFELIHREQ
ncbi:MAG: ABC transporter substrate-binding protein [Elusimicrobiota bacterium]